jgi:hypothetical protein
MANPNLGAISGIFGKNVANINIGSSMTSVLTAQSNRVYKVNTVLISNISDTQETVIGADIDKGSVQVSLVENVTIPIGASFTAIDRQIPVYLEEGESIRVKCNTAANVHVLVSYEDMG